MKKKAQNDIQPNNMAKTKQMWDFYSPIKRPGLAYGVQQMLFSRITPKTKQFKTLKSKI